MSIVILSTVCTQSILLLLLLQLSSLVTSGLSVILVQVVGTHWLVNAVHPLGKYTQHAVFGTHRLKPMFQLFGCAEIWSVWEKKRGSDSPPQPTTQQKQFMHHYQHLQLSWSILPSQEWHWHQVTYTQGGIIVNCHCGWVWSEGMLPAKVCCSVNSGIGITISTD